MTGEGRKLFKGKVTDMLADGYILGITVSSDNGDMDIDLEPLLLPNSTIEYGSDVRGFMTGERKNLVASSIAVKKNENGKWQSYGRV